MTPDEAKVWLIDQILLEADRENVVLDEFEKRMLEFSETNKTPSDFAELNTAFAVDHEDVEYEEKIADLVRNRLHDLCAINSPDIERWQKAVAMLSEDDHYLSVMINMAERKRSTISRRRPHDRLKLILTAAAIAILVFVAILFLQNLSFNIGGQAR